jgi:hypothetical protein
MRSSPFTTFAVVTAVLSTSAFIASGTPTAAGGINTTGMGAWMRPTIEGLLPVSDYIARHVLYGEPHGTTWASPSFEKRASSKGAAAHARVALAEVLHNPDAPHRWELIKITSLNDTDAFYTVGYAEGLVTHVNMFNTWHNTVARLQPGVDDPKMPAMLSLIEYLRNYPHQDTEYGRMVPQLMRQIDGLWAGWAAAYKATGSPADMANFTWFSVFFSSYQDDYGNLPPHANFTSNPARGGDEATPLLRPQHCTSVHHIAPDGDLLVGHATGEPFDAMTARQLKTYVFSKGRTVTFSGYPGMIASFDDFSVSGHGIMLTSTMIASLNTSNKALGNMRAVPGAFGTMIASYLSVTPLQWAATYSTDDGGTYSAMLMITDMRAAHAAFASNETLPSGTFVVLEAVPTSVVYADMTAKLVTDGSWFSFDVAYFNATRRLVGMTNTGAFGLVDYDTCVTAAGPRRDMQFVANSTTMFYAMRHNNFPNDPAQGLPAKTMPWCTRAQPCPANATRSPMFGSSPRGDLPLLDSRAHAMFPPDAFGGIDAKVTSAQMLFQDPSRPTFIMQNGPTFVQQEPFSFEAYYAKHPEQRKEFRGLPDTWTFPPALLTPHANLSSSNQSADAGIATSILVAAAATAALAVVAVAGLIFNHQRQSRRSLMPEPVGESTKLV